MINIQIKMYLRFDFEVLSVSKCLDFHSVPNDPNKSNTLGNTISLSLLCTL